MYGRPTSSNIAASVVVDGVEEGDKRDIIECHKRRASKESVKLIQHICRFNIHSYLNYFPYKEDE